MGAQHPVFKRDITKTVRERLAENIRRLLLVTCFLEYLNIYVTVMK